MTKIEYVARVETVMKIVLEYWEVPYSPHHNYFTLPKVMLL
jgi:hypothetical protein